MSPRKKLSPLAESLGLDFEPEDFKVWGQIEAQGDPDKDQFENLGEPVGLGTFATYDEANAFLSRLSADGYDADGKAVASRDTVGGVPIEVAEAAADEVLAERRASDYAQARHDAAFLSEDDGATLFCDVCHQQVRSNEAHSCPL